MARFSDIADVDFMGDITLSEIKKRAIAYYTEELKRATGNTAVSVSDERKAELYATAQILYQLMQTANDKGKQNLLKYARGSYLDNIVLSRSMTRKTAESAVCTVRFTLSSERTEAVVIPKGTRVTTPGRQKYFATDETVEIPSGQIYTDVICTATEGGSSHNDLAVGELNTIVDPIAYVASAANTDITQGGADAETDDALAERFFNAKNEFSTAGSEDAYKYYTKSYSSTIDDVYVENPDEAQIEIYILLKSREAATEGFITDLTNYLSNPKIKPLTDIITVHNIEKVNYTIDVSYTVYTENTSKLAEIQKAVAEAVENYKIWQCGKIGRDINNQKLISCMIEAGAATVAVKAPEAATVGKTQIAQCVETSVTYTGTTEA